MDYKEILAKILYYPIKIKNITEIKKYYKNIKININNLEKIDKKIYLNKSLIIAPHVDDETIGLGGVLSNSTNNEFIDLLYMTDSGGSVNSTNKNIKELRKEEAKELKDKLGLNKLFIFNISNNESYKYEEYAIKELTNVLNNNIYENIFIVSPFDAHLEHRWANDIFKKVINNLDFNKNIILYEVSNFLPNDLINSYEIINIKDKDILYYIFKSQNKTMDFDIFNQLNKYKGLSIGISESVEFFAVMNKIEYLNILNRLGKYKLSKIIPNRIGNHRSFYKVIKNEKTAQKNYKEMLN